MAMSSKPQAKDILVEMVRVAVVTETAATTMPEPPEDRGPGLRPMTGVATEIMRRAAEKTLDRMAGEFVEALAAEDDDGDLVEDLVGSTMTREGAPDSPESHPQPEPARRPREGGSFVSGVRGPDIRDPWIETADGLKRRRR